MTEEEKKRKQLREYARYSGMATEMFALLVIMVLLGKYIDREMGNPKKYVTAFLVLFGLGGYLFRLYYQLTKSNKK